MSWGFAIPPSSVLFVDLSNRITNSYIHGRRITNSPEQVNWIANPNTQFCRITNCFTLRPATVGSPEREKPPENATNATIMPPREPPETPGKWQSGIFFEKKLFMRAREDEGWTSL